MKSLLFTFLALLSCLTAGAVCTASFTSSVSGNTATFTNTSTYSGYTNPAAYYTIVYGDGGYGYPGQGGSISHTYGSPGTYNVTLIQQVIDSTASGITSCIDSFFQTITITPPPCASYITVSPGGTGPTRTFAANNYAGTPGMSYTWYFGDGNSATGSPVTHTYAAAGTYQVVLVSIGGGCLDSAFATVTVTAPFNCATANASFTQYVSGSAVYFNSTSTPGLSSAYNMSLSWSFGDGGTGAGFSPIHVYAASGTYQVTLVVQWIDSVSSNVVCTDSAVSSVTVTVANCSAVNAAYTYTVSGTTVSFTNTSTPTSMPGAVPNYQWYFDDGTTSNATNPTHTYTSGTYTAMLLVKWTDSSNPGNILCIDSVAQTITVVSNEISGYIGYDSLYYNPSQVDTFKVWLIKYDTASQILYAVDSQITGGPYNTASYAFYNKAPGVYRTKAAHLNGPGSGTGLLPTYHANSLYWNTATQIVHTGGASIYKTINMQGGTVTGGPGFIGGNVTQGANKGTGIGDPVPDLLVFLRDAGGSVIRMTYTDAAGNFSFNGLPVGNYSVYPEALNYTTTPYTSIVVNATQPSVSNVFFKQTEDYEIRPIPTSVGSGPGRMAAGKVYPNPAHDQLHIITPLRADQLQVSVISLTGRVVAAYGFSNVAAGADHSISVKELPAGLYLIRVQADGLGWTEKVQIR